MHVSAANLPTQSHTRTVIQFVICPFVCDKDKMSINKSHTVGVGVGGPREEEGRDRWGWPYSLSDKMT